MYACNLKTWEAETGDLQQVKVRPGYIIVNSRLSSATYGDSDTEKLTLIIYFSDLALSILNMKF